MIWYSFLTVLSIERSTKWSIGSTMKGIQPNPIIVGMNLIGTGPIFPPAGNFTLTKYSVLCTILLMMNPGMATLAKSCQSNASNDVIATFFVTF